MSDQLSNREVMELLRDAKPGWKTDGLGVRGNPVETHREQALVDVPRSSVSRRTVDANDVFGLNQDPMAALGDSAPAPPTNPFPVPGPGQTSGPVPNKPIFDPLNPPDVTLTVYNAPQGISWVMSPYTWDSALIYNDPTHHVLQGSVNAVDIPGSGATIVVLGIRFGRIDQFYGQAGSPAPFVPSPSVLTVYQSDYQPPRT